MINDEANMQDNDLSLAAQRRIDRRCLAFEDAWKSGDPPIIEQFLQDIPEAEHASLLRELLLIDVACRRERGQETKAEEYETRFPGYAKMIAEVLRPAPLPPPREVAGSWPAIHIRCPHCHNPIEVVDCAEPAKMVCPSCGSVFALAADSRVGSQSGDVGTAQRSLERIAHFELLELRGEGAFGAVWKARDTKLNRIVAIKIPRRTQVLPSDIQRFLREAQASAELRHPNIVGVFEVGQQGDVVYIVSEFIEGKPLDKWLESQGRRLTDREAASLCVTIAEALAYAHEHGVIHRDLKPSNIMVDSTGQPHLLDFGLAKRDAGEITMTVDGAILGTPAYMSPEQARGEGHLADGRTDVYSLGVILFELLTGERPFHGDVRMLLTQVVEDEAPSARQFDGRIARDLETICSKCLQKQPEDRYLSCRQLAEDLAHWLRDEPIAARPICPAERFWRWGRRNPMVAALSAAVAFLILMAVVANSGYWKTVSRHEDTNTTVPDISLDTDGTSAPAMDPFDSTNSGVPSKAKGRSQVLGHRQPTVVGFKQDQRVGFPHPIQVVFDDASPAFFLKDKSEMSGPLNITRMFFCREDYVPMVGVPNTVESRKVNLWVPVRGGACAQATSNATNEARSTVCFRPTRPLEDGVYCLHGGTLANSESPPSFCAPFIVRGYGIPKIEGTRVEVDGANITLTVVVRNLGGGEFNDGLLITTVQKREGRRSIFKDRKNLGMKPISARTQKDVEISWKTATWEPGTYCFYGHINYEHLWDANVLAPFESEPFVVGMGKNGKTGPSDSPAVVPSQEAASRQSGTEAKTQKQNAEAANRQPKEERKSTQNFETRVGEPLSSSENVHQQRLQVEPIVDQMVEAGKSLCVQVLVENADYWRGDCDLSAHNS